MPGDREERESSGRYCHSSTIVSQVWRSRRPCPREGRALWSGGRHTLGSSWHRLVPKHDPNGPCRDANLINRAQHGGNLTLTRNLGGQVERYDWRRRHDYRARRRSGRHHVSVDEFAPGKDSRSVPVPKSSSLSHLPAPRVEPLSPEQGVKGGDDLVGRSSALAHRSCKPRLHLVLKLLGSLRISTLANLANPAVGAPGLRLSPIESTGTGPSILGGAALTSTRAS
jgi:hypothetical protein